MGAFFLTDNIESYKCKSALDMFCEMGFSSPRKIEIDDFSIYVYNKMVTGEDNILSENDYTLISIGTPIYKGNNYADSLSSLLKDYMDSSISHEKLFGQYTILFCHAGKVEVLRDPLGCKHVFTDNNYHIISSHMLPICQCLPGGLHINRKAFYEKMMTGFIMSPNTLFEEIFQVDNDIADKINKSANKISFMSCPKVDLIKRFAKKKSICIIDQASELQAYFESIKEYSKNGVDIGLSGGYDSRLILACLFNYTKEKMHLHSHCTEDVHNIDLQIAKQMANYVGVPCHVVNTKTLKHCDHIHEVLRNSILYFDGRSSYSIGGCGEVYTALYRKASTEETPFSLTGIGGELYRNVFDIGFDNIRFHKFMEDKVFSQYFKKAISRDLYQIIKRDVINRASTKLGVDGWRKYTKIIAHRYYCEIMMPDGQGVALDAYNQVSSCIAPFLEPKIIAKGYEAIDFHNSGGEFEGELIKYIDPGLAAIISTYGYPIGKRPVKAKIKEKLRSFIPTSMWNQLADISIRRKKPLNANHLLDDFYANSNELEEAYSYINYLFPEINFAVLLQSSEDIRRLQFMAMVLHMYKERIVVK